jgi:hypothetical protein
MNVRATRGLDVSLTGEGAIRHKGSAARDTHDGPRSVIRADALGPGVNAAGSHPSRAGQARPVIAKPPHAPARIKASPGQMASA